MLNRFFLLLSCMSTILCLPTVELKPKTLLTSSNPELLPEKQPQDVPDLSQMVEIKEQDIPEGTWVLEVEEAAENRPAGESMDTASNVVFRPLFRYRQVQANRRYASSGLRRRYYVPRRSYRQSGYYSRCP